MVEYNVNTFPPAKIPDLKSEIASAQWEYALQEVDRMDRADDMEEADDANGNGDATSLA